MNEARLIRLDNGVRVALDPMPGLMTVAIALIVRTGSRWEDPAQSGIAHLLEHMAFKGAGGLDARGLANAVERIGASINASTGHERVVYSARGLKRDAAMLTGLLCDMVLEPRLTPAELALEKGVILQEMAEAQDEPLDVAFELHQATTFGDGPLGRPILGTPETLATIDVATLADFLVAGLEGDRVILSIAGGFDEAAVEAACHERLGVLPAGNGRGAPAARARAGLAQSHRKDVSQSQLIVSLGGPMAGAPDAIAARVATEILGGGTSSRLFQEVREARGLVYGIDAWLDIYDDIGRLGVSAGCDPKSAGEVISLVTEAIDALAANGPTPQELQRARAMLGSQILFAAESPAGRCDARAGQVALRDRIVAFSEIADWVEAVSASDVRQAMRDAIAGPVVAVSQGPKAGLAAAETFHQHYATAIAA
jgi:predicted Zn-dependent peptidase